MPFNLLTEWLILRIKISITRLAIVIALLRGEVVRHLRIKLLRCGMEVLKLIVEITEVVANACASAQF